MSDFLKKHNSDDVYFRTVIAGLLNYMSDKLYTWNYIDGEKVIYPVPFYYNAAGDERFMQDMFQQHTLNDCINDMVVEGNSDVIPRGHITLSSITVNASELSNRFVRGEYTKIEGNEVVTYNAPMNIIPLNLNFDVEIRSDGYGMTFKLAQRVIEVFYKAYAFEFLWENMPMRGSVAFPEDNAVENIYEFGFSDSTMSKLNFQIEVEVKLPVPDLTNQFKSSNRIENFDSVVSAGPAFWPDKGMDGERLATDFGDTVIPSGSVTMHSDDLIIDGNTLLTSEDRVKYLETLFDKTDEKIKKGSHTNLGDPTSEK